MALQASSFPSSSFINKWHYHVFLSFRGSDTRHGFTGNLYKALRDKGIRTFLDDQELRGGEEVVPALVKAAIQDSRIAIVVFSQNYASSSLCLQELATIIECVKGKRRLVFPVFYDVHPSDVGYQRGNYGEAMCKHEERFKDDKEKVQSWRKALRYAADLSGMHFRFGNNEYEYVFIEKIVEVISHEISRFPLRIADYPVGLESRVLEVNSLLNDGFDCGVRMVGIHGIGGIGKTTLARAIYNFIGDQFDNICFLENVREKSINLGLVRLQETLLSKMLGYKNTRLESVPERISIIEQRLHQKKVLLVLDDVNKTEQLDALCGSHKWFGSGSIIIITTRDKRLLIGHRVDLVHSMKEMDESESSELFSWHAFKKASPRQDFVELCGNVVSYCGGLPLALSVLGSELFGKEMTRWKNVLDGLREVPHPIVQQVLRISFDDLNDDKERNLFLDISFFYIGINKEDVIHALKGYGGSVERGITVLEDRSLIKVDENRKFGMHVLLREMGREILRELSPIEPGQRVYDVFLSFRGEDTRATFTSHLQSSLENAGIYVFKDDSALPRGERISISLLKAIGESLISIIVLSKNYTNSRWCLQELENIMVCYRTRGQLVVPVFYGVNPSDVRDQTGMFGQAFEDLIKEISVEEDKVLSWRTALREVGGLSGIVVVNSRNESEDVKRVIEDVTRLLDRTELFVAVHPVGVTSRVQDVIEQLNNQQRKDVLLLGIWGMGGMGKTTIAKAIYNQIGRNFEGRSFLLNIRGVWEQDNGPVMLQERFIFDIYKTTKIQIHSIELGKNILKQRLAQKRVFLVLDDVTDLDQLNALCGSRKWFGDGSAVIITTRDEHLLRTLGVDRIYGIEQMNTIESIELFSWHAFKQPNPKEDFFTLSKQVVEYCQGLPLALEVLGAYLYDREISQWKSALKKLEKIPKDKVQDKLKVSFDNLEDGTQKEIFLDIACFFIGRDRSDVVQILNGCDLHAEIGISVLIERSLVTVDNNNNLGMHDLLRDMGRAIIREKSLEKRSRLWSHEEVLDVLEKYKGTKAITGLALKSPRANPIPLSTKAFKKMKNLKLLQLAGVQLDGDFENLSRDLRWLHWNGFPLIHTPADFYQGSLVVIELEYSNLKLVWKDAQMLDKLKILNLSHSHALRKTPNFSYLPNLEKLILEDCPSLSSVSRTIGFLNELLLINLKDCINLRNLPISIYKLKSLKTFILSGCLKIDKLEEDLEQMESLTILKADNTAIRQVPNAIARLKSIGYISLCGFEGLARDVIPSIIWSWTSPRNKLLSLRQTCAGMSPVSLDVVPNSTLWAKCGSQVSNINTSALVDCRSQDDILPLKNSLSFFLIEIGKDCQGTEILRQCISKEPRTSALGDWLLPCDKYPDWLTFNGEGSTVIFQVPQVNERALKTLMLCIVYSSPDGTTSEGFIVLRKLLIINYTKRTTHDYEGEMLTSLQDEGRHSVLSNLEPGDDVKVVVAFSYGFTVKKTAVYLIYDEPIDQNMEHWNSQIKDLAKRKSKRKPTSITNSGVSPKAPKSQKITSMIFDATTKALTSPDRSLTSKVAALIQLSSHEDQVLQEKTHATDQLPSIEDLKLVSATDGALIENSTITPLVVGEETPREPPIVGYVAQGHQDDAEQGDDTEDQGCKRKAIAPRIKKPKVTNASTKPGASTKASRTLKVSKFVCHSPPRSSTPSNPLSHKSVAVCQGESSSAKGPPCDFIDVDDDKEGDFSSSPVHNKCARFSQGKTINLDEDMVKATAKKDDLTIEDYNIDDIVSPPNVEQQGNKFKVPTSTITPIQEHETEDDDDDEFDMGFLNTLNQALLDSIIVKDAPSISEARSIKNTAISTTEMLKSPTSTSNVPPATYLPIDQISAILNLLNHPFEAFTDGALKQRLIETANSLSQAVLPNQYQDLGSSLRNFIYQSFDSIAMIQKASKHKHENSKAMDSLLKNIDQTRKQKIKVVEGLQHGESREKELIKEIQNLQARILDLTTKRDNLTKVLTNGKQHLGKFDKKLEKMAREKKAASKKLEEANSALEKAKSNKETTLRIQQDLKLKLRSLLP